MTAPSGVNLLIRDLSARLIAGATATETLLAWCEEHGLAEGPITVERQQQLVLSAVPYEVRAALGPASNEAVHYRQVRLVRGSVPLAVAENWFLPDRLTANMNEVLNQSTIPFGTVIAPLRPSRRTLIGRPQPLTVDPSEDPERPRGSTGQRSPEIILEHVAVILGGSGTVLALVKEHYLADLIAVASSLCCRACKGQPEKAAARPVRLEQ
ncbi:hypothetical protein [Microvirga sp. M2]|uniref:hypothetical protein n=1 Tax=Microvirga sp. M2 TaxID=3073270 RepID=UPI0039C08634